VLKLIADRKIAVVIPAHNESKNLPIVLERMPKYVDYVIVVDDNSDDNTAEIAKLYNAIVLRHKINYGVGAAIKTGYKKALSLSADIIVVVAGDGQHDPQEIAKLVNPIIKNEADYVIGDRLGDNPLRKGMPHYRYVGNKLLSLATRFISLIDVRDSQNGFTAIRADSLRLFNFNHLTNRWGFPNDMIFEASIHKLRVKNVPITTIYYQNKRKIESHIKLREYIFRLLSVLFRGYVRVLRYRFLRA